MSDAINPLSERGCQATPYADLIAQIMDCMEPKNEREWAAKREIERLTADRDRLAAKLTRMTRSRDVWMRRAAACGWPVFEAEEAYLAEQEKHDE